MNKFFFTIIALVILTACGSEETNTISNPEEYNAYLSTEPFRPGSKYFDLWNNKIKADSTQTLALYIVAGEYDRYFKATGEISYLKKAEAALLKAVEHAAVGTAGYLRALARNYISQHRFKAADSIAGMARKLGSGVRDSRALLFDTAMELGNYKRAEQYLDSLKNMEDFGYLIRLAKYNDYKGDLDTAIRTLEKAMLQAERAKNSAIRIWSYTNLADFYGHAGRINEAYNHYLKALELDPGNAYAKKGIAWILYSYEDNPAEALRILDSVTKINKSPDYYLLKAEIAAYAGQDAVAAASEDAFFQSVANPGYGVMYNSIKANRLMAENGKKALQLAQQEVLARPTPETYALLALIKSVGGEREAALRIIREEVVGKSSEPAILLTVAKIYKEAGQREAVAEIKQDLLASKFELGPVVIKEVEAL